MQPFGEKIDEDMNATIWVDGLCQQVKFRNKALPEIITHIHQLQKRDFKENAN